MRTLIEKLLWEIGETHKIFKPPMVTWSRVAYPEFYKVKALEELKKKFKNKRQICNTLYYLKRKKYVIEKAADGQKFFVLTPLGRSKILKIKLKLKSKNLKKDGKYRIIIFDIPEKEKLKREYFRKGLKYFGFEQLQKSVWVSPFDVLKELKLFVRECRLEKDVKYILATKIE